MHIALTVFMAAAAAAQATGGAVPADSFYSLKTTTLQGKPADLSQYTGRVALVVNVASECGFTPQYAGLEKLHEELQGRGFTVLGFPSNEFGKQEPGSAEQIQDFCKRNYGVTFPMFSKLATKTGAGQSPVYEFLGRGGHLPQWTVAKYVIGGVGKVIAFFDSKVTPESKELRDQLEAALGH